MMYNELVEFCFFSPKHVGVIDLSEPLSVHDRVGESGRGDVLDFYLLCDKQGFVLKARFKAYGNPYLVAAAELICQQLEGSKIQDHPNIDHVWLVKQLEIPKTRYPVALQIEDGYREVVMKMKLKLSEEK
ncbi:iron-sulfer cluster proteins NifU [Legionella lansingensis]|uniref:Putative iron-sulpher cluster proteins NifU n=1 Tax=Legionella lansingensis TaxID=45067 RepID=A0A0W0VXM5_9GAMM|nr:iron-sulfur cluster assembly scaffold protein [Legionella lansingensis]KTD24771.1 putative iron-sulpher cluster proteins NifU [Legionella lansingensis]SNV48887.1 iron-sulfer cluster proteins NifU [Legionella lansingensis]